MSDSLFMHRFLLVFFLFQFSAHAWPIKEQVLFTENDPVEKMTQNKWINIAGDARESIQVLLAVLKKSPTAKSDGHRGKKESVNEE